ncbi:unnamed protein product [Amoebophrya sp. A25]|nr:unnamed protein product [Amoebophrya sp. A25]|eukprot:GSA25T00026607001.1
MPSSRLKIFIELGFIISIIRRPDTGQKKPYIYIYSLFQSLSSCTILPSRWEDRVREDALS